MLQKNAKTFHHLFPGKTPLMLKKCPPTPPPPPKSNNFHAVPAVLSWSLPYYYWPVIVVLQQYADGMATV